MFEHYCIELARNGNVRILGAFPHLQHAMILHEHLRDWRTVVVDKATLNLFQLCPQNATALYLTRWRDWQGQPVEGAGV